MRTLSLVVLCALMVGLLGMATAGYAQAQEHKISLNLVDADIRDALSMLFRDTGKNFVLASDANTTARVTMSLDGVDFETALRLLLQQAGLRFQVAGDVYTISAAATPPVDRHQPPPIKENKRVDTPYRPPVNDVDTYDTTTGEGARKVTRAITVLYSDAMELAGLFGGTVAKQRFGTDTGTGQNYGQPFGTPYGSGPYGSSPYGSYSPYGAGTTGGYPYGSTSGRYSGRYTGPGQTYGTMPRYSGTGSYYGR